MENLTFHSEDNGNCRVYYKAKGGLYCWQLDDPRMKSFSFYVCTRDGEPSHEVQPPEETPIPPGAETIGKELAVFLTQYVVTDKSRQGTLLIESIPMSKEEATEYMELLKGSPLNVTEPKIMSYGEANYIVNKEARA